MPISRRGVLKTAGAVVVYRLAGPRPALKAAGPNGEIGMGFIGVGIRGSYLLDSFRKTPGVRPLMAADVYDGHLAWAKETTGGSIDTSRDYHAVLDRKDIDAVAIASPEHWHARMVLDALAAGKHVYVEKPLAWSIQEGGQLVAAQKKSGKLVMVGSQSKTSPAIAKARELIKSGLIGKVNMVRMITHRNYPEGAWVYPIPPDASPQTIDWLQFLGPAPKVPFDAQRFFRWRCWWEYSGGIPSDLWVHELSALHEMLDVRAPKSVVAQGGIFRWNDGRTVPDVLSAVFEYDGFLVDLYANLANGRGGGNPIIAMGSDGTLTFDARGALFFSSEPPPPAVPSDGLNGWPKALKDRFLASVVKSAVAPPPKPDQEIKIERGLEHYEYFVQSLREGLPSKETAEEGHCAAGAAHLGNLAFRKGRRMKWDVASNQVSEG
jgi:predicted dehydrogenase